MLEREEKKKKVDKNHSKEPSKQPTLHQSIESNFSHMQENFLDVRNWTLLLVDVIAVDIQVTSITKDKRFQKFVNALDHRYALPSRRTIMKSMLPARYERIRKGLKVKLSSVQYCVSSDTSSSSRVHNSYM